jgi:CO/xanthine dehydrogenase Mo-binding subunit
MCVGPYEVPNIRVDSSVIFTNNLPRCAFRGFGAPQAAFVAESQINKLADALNMDPVELRLRNVWHADSLMAVNTPPPKGFRIDKVIKATALEAGWTTSPGGWMRESRMSLKAPTQPHIRRGVGFACGFKNVGDGGGVIRENAWSIVELHGKVEIEKVIVRHAGAELGQGAHTALAQIAAEVLEVPLEIIQMVVSDSTQTRDSGYTSASRTIFMAGNAIKGAAEQALQKWKDENRPAIAANHFFAPPTTPFDPDTGQSNVNFSFGYAAETAEVEVDTETGEIHITNMICADDVGKAINPQNIEGQIEGSIVQGVGFAITENFIEKDGYVLTPNFSTYLIPTAYDIPDRVKSLILENPDPLGPLGARGMGEMPIVPVAAAIVAAVHDATGVWFDEFPLTPERVLAGLGKLDR